MSIPSRKRSRLRLVQRAMLILNVQMHSFPESMSWNHITRMHRTLCALEYVRRQMLSWCTVCCRESRHTCLRSTLVCFVCLLAFTLLLLLLLSLAGSGGLDVKHDRVSAVPRRRRRIVFHTIRPAKSAHTILLLLLII